MEYFAFAMNNWFPRVIPDVSNSEVFFEMIRIEMLGKQVVERLKFIEKNDIAHWYRDVELIGLFDRLYKCGCITLPKDPVHRIRWIALACVLFSKQRGFSYGNVLIPHDWVPDDQLIDFSHWGRKYIEEAQEFRMELRKKGWKWLLTPA